MSASRNPEAMTPAQGEFSSRVAPSEPLTTKGHAPGVKVGNDAVPEFNAEVHPAGTAPKSQSFRPNNTSEVPGQALNPDMEGATSAADTLMGATSADVHTGYGHPGSGMTSQELHGGKGKRDRSGLEGVGTSASDPFAERGLDRDHETGLRTKQGVVENLSDLEGKGHARTATGEDVASERR
jgi:hypothetical protein